MTDPCPNFWGHTYEIYSPYTPLHHERKGSHPAMDCFFNQKDPGFPMNKRNIHESIVIEINRWTNKYRISQITSLKVRWSTFLHRST